MSKCWDCRFYAGDQYKGTCHRFPPSGSGFAVVQPDDWCGEFVKQGDVSRRLDASAASLVDRMTKLTYHRADV